MRSRPTIPSPIIGARLRLVLPSLLMACLSWGAPNTTVSVIHHFSARGSDGRYPKAELVHSTDGWLYGTTPVGGNANQGTVFRLRPDGKAFETLHHFTKLIGDGGAPVGPLWESGDGTFIGLSEAGGDASLGTVYRIAGDGSKFAVIRSFAVVDDGQGPTRGLIQSANGLLYGTTDFGGTFKQGAVFVIAEDGSYYRVLHFFRGLDGARPRAPLLGTKGGVLFGTTSSGGTQGRGTVFRIRVDGSDFRTLHHFAGGQHDGQTPITPLIEDSEGTLFGLTLAGGTLTQGGALFRIEKDGTGYRMLRGFSRLGGEPNALGNGLVLIRKSELLCTSLRGGQHDKGTVFSIANDGKELRVLHHFAGSPHDGFLPVAGLIKAGDGTFYGTTERGGMEDAGTVYCLVLGK